jgi:hypothetical protein
VLAAKGESMALYDGDMSEEKKDMGEGNDSAVVGSCGVRSLLWMITKMNPSIVGVWLLFVRTNTLQVKGS